MKKIFKNIPTYFFVLLSCYICLLILKEIHFFSVIYNFIYSLRPCWIGIIITLFLFPFIKEKRKSKVRIINVYLSFILIFSLLFTILFYIVYKNSDLLLILMNDYFPKLLMIIKKYELDNFIQMEHIQNIALNSYELIIPLLNNVFSFITNFVFSILISFFISLENDFFINKIKIYIKNYDIYFYIYDIFSNILIRFVQSTLLDILYIIFTTSFILFIFRTPNPVLLSFLLSFLNIFPFVGSILGNGLLIIIHFIFVGDNTFILFIVLLVNSQIESNLIHTWICNKTMKIHPLSLFFSILISEYLFGIIGIILSPIVASILQMTLLTYHEYLNKKDIGGWEKIIS